jgi:hypothetical protein
MQMMMVSPKFIKTRVVKNGTRIMSKRILTPLLISMTMVGMINANLSMRSAQKTMGTRGTPK